MYTVKKLSAMPYAQAHIKILDDGSVHLFSYVTRVAIYRPDKWLMVTGLSSMTTRRHISAFLKEYVPSVDFQMAKYLVQEHLAYNTETGEVVEIEASDFY